MAGVVVKVVVECGRVSLLDTIVPPSLTSSPSLARRHCTLKQIARYLYKVPMTVNYKLIIEIVIFC